MSEDEEIALAKKLPKGARRAILAMTTKPTLPGKVTFNANAAHNLRRKARSHGGLADHIGVGGRWAYYLTPLGERIKARLAPEDSAS